MAEHGMPNSRWHEPIKGISHQLPEGFQVRPDKRFHKGRIRGGSVAGAIPHTEKKAEVKAATATVAPGADGKLGTEDDNIPFRGVARSGGKIPATRTRRFK